MSEGPGPETQEDKLPLPASGQKTKVRDKPPTSDRSQLNQQAYDQLPPPEPQRVPPLKEIKVPESPTTEAELTRSGDPGTHQHPVTLGRYQIKIKLGSGGFGVVYKAYDAELQRDVAI